MVVFFKNLDKIYVFDIAQTCSKSKQDENLSIYELYFEYEVKQNSHNVDITN